VDAQGKPLADPIVGLTLPISTTCISSTAIEQRRLQLRTRGGSCRRVPARR
jgi:hypothetical protein